MVWLARGPAAVRPAACSVRNTMKNIVLGAVVALFGASILQGNISHSAYGFMTVFAAVLVVGGVCAIVKGVRERRAKPSS